MSDQDFDFKPPSQRREPRPFEPPPWERDQFDELARELEERREEDEGGDQGDGGPEADASVAGPAQEGVHSEAGGAGSDGQTQAGAGEEPAAPQTGPQDEQESAGRPDAEAPDGKQVELLMLNLRAEESEPLGGVWIVGVAAGAFLALVGIAVLVWGVLALANRRLGQLGTNGGLVLSVFGASFVAIGVWVVIRSLRQRGVL